MLRCFDFAQHDMLRCFGLANPAPTAADDTATRLHGLADPAPTATIHLQKVISKRNPAPLRLHKKTATESSNSPSPYLLNLTVTNYFFKDSSALP